MVMKTLCGRRIALVAGLAGTMCSPVVAEEGATAKSVKAELPGRIYVAVPPVGSPQHGLLAVDPNDRTCVTIDETAGPGARVAPGGRRIATSKVEAAPRTFSLSVIDLDRDAAPVTIPGGPWVVSWRSDGGELTLSRMGRDLPGEERANWRIKPDGSGREKLPVPATEVIWDWSSDGEWFVTSSDRRAAGDGPVLGLPFRPIYVVRRDGSEARELVPPGAPAKAGFGGTMNAGGPSGVRFSPDGRSVVYIRATTEVDSETRKLTRLESRAWIVSRDGKERRQVFEGSNEEGYPYSAVWSPDGKWLALGLQVPREDNAIGLNAPRLLIMDASGKNAREIPLPQPSMMTVVDWR